MKILLAYSKTHFNPGKSSKYKNASAGINARVLYEILCQYGEVDYIDVSETNKVKGKRYDLFVGINNNFNIIHDSIKCKKCIYYAVTQHPDIFAKKLITFKNRRKIYVLNEILYQKMVKARLDKLFNIHWKKEIPHVIPNLYFVDRVIVIGNEITANTYFLSGVENNKINILSYELMKGKAAAKEKRGKRIKVAFIAANIYLGKGFDIFFQMMYWMYKENYNFDITIIGACDNPYYKGLIDKMKHWNIRVRYEGMVYDEQYYNILKRQDFYILPSLSEGQAGTVLDAMYCGVIPIMTREAGVGYFPLGILHPEMNSKNNYLIIKKALNMKKREIEILSRETAAYYNKNHLGFRERLDKLIKEFVVGNEL